jgi:hypothetical protein
MRVEKLYSALLSMALFGSPHNPGRADMLPLQLRPLQTTSAPLDASTTAMTPEQAERFLDDFVHKENPFYQPGVSYDDKTGVTVDGHPIAWKTGELLGDPRTFSAASKESLHLAFLALAVGGNPTARKLLAPTDGSGVDQRVLSVLEKKIATYERFDREFPGFGGFLPWYKIADGRIVPDPHWMTRVPGLDNGQLAWSVYLAAHVLEDHGHHDLARRYAQHLEKMKANVVRVFYDPLLRQLRCEAVLLRGPDVPPEHNAYRTKDAHFLLDDAFEGTLLGEFAASFGVWQDHPEGRDAIWSTPRRVPALYRAPKSRVKITIDEGNWHSSHEQWAYGVLPYLDDPIMRVIFENTQRARTINAAERGERGLAASVNGPRKGDGDTEYISALGIRARGINKEKLDRRHVYTPYGAFPLGLVTGGRPVYASWLAMMANQPGMSTPYGIAESYSASGKRHAPLLTWDVKGLVALGILGGLGDVMRPYMQKDGIYDAFRERVRADRSAFDGKPIVGTDAPLRDPCVRLVR